MATILLVDDDDLFLNAMKAPLEKAGYAVRTASNGLKAVDIVRRESIDVVVLDLFMPVMEGLETLKLMQREKPALPIYVVSGGGQKQLFEMLEVAEGLGAVGTLRKPVTANELIALIEGEQRKKRQA